MGITILRSFISGRSVLLDQQLASSGEGTVWTTNIAGFLAKLYHTPSPERIKKLEVMIAHPPQNPMREHHHITFAWPQDLLQNTQGQCVGFLMPEIVDGVKLSLIYNAKLRNRKAPRFNWFYLHTAALNFALSLKSLHEEGYVVGDVKPQNLLVNSRALISIIDTDSFQVRDPLTQTLYRCTVGSEGFTPAELLGKELSTIDQTDIHDRFRLGVMIYLLLFGDQPFKGKWMGRGESPQPAQLIREGYWPYGPHSLIQPGPNTIPLSIIHPQLQVCFQRCFTEGHQNPQARPSAHDWSVALKQAIADLKMCNLENNHFYSHLYGRCYWCDRRAALGLDVFSPQPAPARPQPVRSGKAKGTRSAPVPTGATLSSLAMRGNSSLAIAKSTALLQGKGLPLRHGANWGDRWANPVMWGTGCILLGLVGLVVLLLPELNVEALQRGGTTVATMLQEGLHTLGVGESKAKLVQKLPILSSKSASTVERQRGGHWDTITALDVSLDDRWLISGSKDMTVKLWDFPSGVLQHTFADHYESIVSVGMSANQKTLVTSSASGKILVWDVGTKELKRSLLSSNNWGLEGTIRSAVADRQGQLVASSGWGGVLLLQDLQNGKVIRIPSNVIGSEQTLAVSANGKTVISTGSEGEFQIWDALTGRLKTSFARAKTGQPFEPMSVLALQSNGRLMASGGWNGSILLWDVGKRQLIRQFPKESRPISLIAISDRGDRLATVTNGTSIKLWNLKKGTLEAKLTTKIGGVTALKFSHSGQYLISGSDEPAIKIWNLATRQVLRVLTQ